MRTYWSNSAKRHLYINPYAIIPLAPNSGLIGWVPDHDTLHQLIRGMEFGLSIIVAVYPTMAVAIPDSSTLQSIAIVARSC